MTTKEAMDHLRTALQDESYRIGWQANIAMAFKDHWSLTPRKNGESEAEYVHRIANGAANAFLEQISPTKELPDDIPGMLAVKMIHKK